MGFDVHLRSIYGVSINLRTVGSDGSFLQSAQSWRSMMGCTLSKILAVVQLNIAIQI
jgi:hypothetical protein